MDGISLSWRLLPQTLIDRHGLRGRIIHRADGSDSEIRFLYRDPRPVLPVWYGDELRIVRWGGSGQPLPRRRTIGHEELHEGLLRELEPGEVDIPASFGFDRGIWYPIREGVQGVLVHDRDGTPVVYVVTREATHYYQVMTRNNREPLLIGETI